MRNKQSFHILINSKAGAVQSMGQAHIEQLLAQSNLNIESINIVPPKKLLKLLEKMKYSGIPVLIGGGDGTIRSCARYALNDKISFGILPFGTMNLLARDLGIPEDFETAIKYYEQSTVLKHIDVGMINDEIFLCCAGIGAMPAASVFREKNRSTQDYLFLPRLVHFIMKKMGQLSYNKFYIKIDEDLQKVETPALVISNNQYTSDTRIGADNFNRASLQDGTLGVYSIAPRNMLDRIRVMVRLAFGNWSKDSAIRSWKAKRVELESSGHLQILSLDGETKAMETPLRFCVKPMALSVLTPQICHQKA